MGLKRFSVTAKCGMAVLVLVFLSTPVVWANESNSLSDLSGFSKNHSERQPSAAWQIQGKEGIFSDSTSFSGKPLGQSLTVAQLHAAPGGGNGGKEEPLPKLIPLGTPEVKKGTRYFGDKFEDRMLNLGAKEDFTLLERSLFKAQVKTFIPPLLVPAIGGHAFVLPPGLFQAAVAYKFANISGDDFNVDGHDNPIHVQNGVRRQFVTASLFYGFDLNMKYLHSFTVRLQVPWQNSSARGPITLPDIGGALGGVNVNNGGNIQGLGDISLFLKKKLLDQANENRFFGIPIPIGLAAAVGVFFPTGSNSQKFGNNGRITISPKNPKNPFAGCPTGAKLPASVGCPNPIFARFSDDGRAPTGLQPGNGDFAFQFAGFATRQFIPGDMPDFLAGTVFDRAAIHLGGFTKLSRAADGVSRGNKYGAFFTAVLPVYKDYLSLQIHNINTVQNSDSYKGNFTPPHQIGTPLAGQKRHSFRRGWTSLLGPSLVFSPDPLIRMTATALFRIKEPELGPSPPYVINLATSYIF